MLNTAHSEIKLMGTRFVVHPPLPKTRLAYDQALSLEMNLQESWMPQFEEARTSFIACYEAESFPKIRSEYMQVPVYNFVVHAPSKKGIAPT